METPEQIATEFLEWLYSESWGSPEFSLMDKLREKTGDLIAQSAGNAFALEQLAYKLADGQARLRERVRDLEAEVEQAQSLIVDAVAYWGRRTGEEAQRVERELIAFAARRGEG